MEVRIYILERRRAIRNSGGNLTKGVITPSFTYKIQIKFTYVKIVIHDGAVKFSLKTCMLLKYVSQYMTFFAHMCASPAGAKGSMIHSSRVTSA